MTSLQPTFTNLNGDSSWLIFAPTAYWRILPPVGWSVAGRAGYRQVIMAEPSHTRRERAVPEYRSSGETSERSVLTEWNQGAKWDGIIYWCCGGLPHLPRPHAQRYISTACINCPGFRSDRKLPLRSAYGSILTAWWIYQTTIKIRRGARIN